jgi:DNA-binding protein YbaB
MFDKLKQLQKLKDLESELGKQILEKEINGVRVAINGKSEIVSISLNTEISKEEQEKALKECINSVCHDARMIMATKAAQISGLSF